jgi:hypothetical protein
VETKNIFVMKPIHVFILSLMLHAPLALRAQETISISTSTVQKVTVYASGCYIERTAGFKAEAGVSVLAIKALSAAIEEGSIQVKAGGDYTILSVRVQQYHPVHKLKPAQVVRLLNKKDSLVMQRNATEPRLFTLEKEKGLLLNNRKLSGHEKQTTLAEIKSMADYYRERLTAIEKDKTRLLEQKEQIIRDIVAVDKQLNEDGTTDIRGKTEGWIMVGISAAKPVEARLDFSYFVPGASWYPVYDFRTEGPAEPITVMQKAVVQQSTGEDWKDVHLVLSGGRPTLSGDKPELRPLTLAMAEPPGAVNGSVNKSVGYNPNETYDQSKTGTLKGQIVDKDSKEPVPFTNVVIEQNGIQLGGATSDFDGNYTIKPVKPDLYDIRCSYLGYKTSVITGFPIRGGTVNVQNIELESLVTALTGVEVSSYKVPLINKDETSTGVVVNFDQKTKMPNRSAKAVSATVGGVFSSSSGSIRGEQGEPMVMYIDGIKAVNNPNQVPRSTREQMEANRNGTNAHTIETDFPINPMLTNRSGGTITSPQTKLSLTAVNPTSSGFAFASNLTKDYEIDVPYSIPSDNKEYGVQIGQFDMKAVLHDETVPKLEPSAFLMAAIPGWESYDLMSAQVNLYYQGTFVGKTSLNTEEVKDTLMLSIGRDAGVVVERHKVREKSGTVNAGNNYKSNLTWEISLRNTHKEAISILVEDQIPVSEHSEVKVELADAGGATYKAEDGRLTWKLTLAPAETRKVSFSYMVKYPKNKGLLNIE